MSEDLKTIRSIKRKKENYDLVDYDYLGKLSPDAVAWLAKFTHDHYEGPGSGRQSRRFDLAYNRGYIEKLRKNRPSFTKFDYAPVEPTPEDFYVVFCENDPTKK